MDEEQIAMKFVENFQNFMNNKVHNLDNSKKISLAFQTLYGYLKFTEGISHEDIMKALERIFYELSIRNEDLSPNPH